MKTTTTVYPEGTAHTSWYAVQPQRIQLKRTKGWRMPAATVKVDRSTRWGNPFNATQDYLAFTQHGFPAPLVLLGTDASLTLCLDLFAAYLMGRLKAEPDFLAPLAHKNLACWCPLDRPCHADLLLRLATYG